MVRRACVFLYVGFNGRLNADDVSGRIERGPTLDGLVAVIRVCREVDSRGQRERLIEVRRDLLAFQTQAAW